MWNTIPRFVLRFGCSVQTAHTFIGFSSISPLSSWGFATSQTALGLHTLAAQSKVYLDRDIYVHTAGSSQHLSEHLSGALGEGVFDEDNDGLTVLDGTDIDPVLEDLFPRWFRTRRHEYRRDLHSHRTDRTPNRREWKLLMSTTLQSTNYEFQFQSRPPPPRCRGSPDHSPVSRDAGNQPRRSRTHAPPSNMADTLRTNSLPSSALLQRIPPLRLYPFPRWLGSNSLPSTSQNIPPPSVWSRC